VHQVQFVIHVITTLVTFAWTGRQQSADVYHAHDFDTLLPALFLARWRKKPIVVYDSHEYWYNESRDESISNAIIRFIERVCAPRCAYVFCVSSSIADRMARHYRIPTPTVLMNVPADVALPPPAPMCDGRPIQVLYHGGYLANRGIESLIAAMALVKESVHLTLRGHGDIELTLRKQVEALGLNDRITFAPSVPMRELVRVASASHIGVIPYLRRHAEWALSNKVFEYMAAGLAFLVNDLVEIRRIVVGHEIGIVCDTEEPESIAQAIDHLASDRPQLEKYRQQAWQTYQDHYTWRSHQQVLLHVYAELERD
jgi:glycogen(starch) synthase